MRADLRGVSADSGGSLSEARPISQQPSRGRRHAVDARASQFSGFRGETTLSDWKAYELCSITIYVIGTNSTLNRV